MNKDKLFDKANRARTDRLERAGISRNSKRLLKQLRRAMEAMLDNDDSLMDAAIKRGDTPTERNALRVFRGMIVLGRM